MSNSRHTRRLDEKLDFEGAADAEKVFQEDLKILTSLREIS